MRIRRDDCSRRSDRAGIGIHPTGATGCPYFLTYPVVYEAVLRNTPSIRHGSREKKRLLAEADALSHGDKGAWLRRNGLYAGQLSNWRKNLAEHGEAALAARKPGRKAADARDKEIERLKKANARLEQRAYVAEQLVDLQKSVAPVRDRQQRSEIMTALQSLAEGVPKAQACRALGVPRHGCYPDRRRRDPRKPEPLQGRGLSPAEDQALLEHLHSERFQGPAPRQVYATLLSEGELIASVSTIYRRLRTRQEGWKGRVGGMPVVDRGGSYEVLTEDLPLGQCHQIIYRSLFLL
ncbi:MAG: hypothetical protein KGY40_08845 [Thioalkalivibrio sp.]|nr:hypothetical protein [Thioalkalivibrio sp.]